MIYVVRIKEGVLFTTISPGGFDLLSAISLTAKEINHDLTITSACDGLHSGIDDPHHLGRAYDIRTHDLPNPEYALQTLQVQLGPLFYAFIEDPDDITHADPDKSNMHIHCQVKKGTIYPPLDPSVMSA
jgi:hypothetical protein